MNFLITAGPTREYIDPVRFISNPSSGKTGVYLARSALRLGHNVRLIAGPVSIKLPRKIRCILVETAEEMWNAVRRNISWADVVVMSAAVGDWRPVRKKAHKIKKDGKDGFCLRLVRNIDILERLSKLKKRGKTKPNLRVIGFSLDTDNIIANAYKKLISKSLDMIIVNPLGPATGFQSDTNKVFILDRSGIVDETPVLHKRVLADRIIRIILQLWG